MTTRRALRLCSAALVALGTMWGTVAAEAEAEVRTGWWNTATVLGTPLPSTTAADDLHVAAEPGGGLAFAAVSFHTPVYEEAVLTLHVTPGTEVGTPSVLACPTKDDSWKAGGDQPEEAAPGYECAGRSVNGVVGQDSTGTTLTFLLDPSAPDAPGVTSLAIVPVISTTSPFSLDLTGPDSSAFRPTTAPTPADTAPAIAPSAPAGRPLPTLAAPQPASVPPLVPPLQATTTAPGPSVAPAPPATGSPAPVLAAGPAVLPPPDRSRRDAGVLLVLVAGLFGVALSQHPRTSPRLLGGRARAAAPVDPVTDHPVHGIGRFARARSQPARRLL